MTDSLGVCIWFTGRSGGGKSTITRALLPMLTQNRRSVSVLDVVPLLKKRWCERTSEGKLLRKAFVAGEIVKHGGVAICVTVSARAEIRQAARDIIGADRFLEVLVEVPPEVALARKARRKRKPSLLKRSKHWLRRQVARSPFRSTTGYDDATSPDLIVDTTTQSAEEGAQAIYRLLQERGFLAAVDIPSVALDVPGNGAPALVSAPLDDEEPA